MSDYHRLYEQALLALSAMSESECGEPMTIGEAEEYVSSIVIDGNYTFKGVRRFLTYTTQDGETHVCTDQEDYKSAVAIAEDWVWQYAKDADEAYAQHEQKLDEYLADPTKHTY